jgi:hypothetical protein
VKSRGLPLKDLEKAQKFLDDVFEALKEPYDPDAVQSLKPTKGRKVARHVTVKIKAFMPLSLAIASPEKYKRLHCKWGWVTKTVRLDDPGAKRSMEDDGDAVPTWSKENPCEGISSLRLPDWVENAILEEKRQDAAIDQFRKIVGPDKFEDFMDGENYPKSFDGFFKARSKTDEEEDYDPYAEKDEDYDPYAERDFDPATDRLLEANEDIEI